MYAFQPPVTTPKSVSLVAPAGTLPFAVSPVSHVNSASVGHSDVEKPPAGVDALDSLLVDAALTDALLAAGLDAVDSEDDAAELVFALVLEALCDDVAGAVRFVFGSCGCGMNSGTTYSATIATSASAASAPMSFGSFDFLFAGNGAEPPPDDE